MNPIERHIYNHEEPYQSIMLYVRSVILRSFEEVYEKLSYGIPFFYAHNKPVCYLNILKGKDYLDVAFIHGILLQDDFSELKDDNQRKQVRSIQIKSLEDLDEKRFLELMQVAINTRKQ